MYHSLIDLVTNLPQTHLVLVGDLMLDRYIFGNAEGTRTAIRAYLYNNSFSANVVDDIPNESRLEPEGWGMASVE